MASMVVDNQLGDVVNLETIQALASEVANQIAGESVAVYVIEKLDRQPQSHELNRAGCSPVGVGLDIWPKFGGRRMFHLITLDLHAAPRLRQHFDKDVRAIAVFISDPNVHDADRPGCEDTRLVYLSEEVSKQGVLAENPAQREDFRAIKPCTFAFHELMLPKIIFNPDIGDKYLVKTEYSRLRDLYEHVCEYSIAGGEALWQRSNFYDGKHYKNTLILQMDEELVDMNMGVTGRFFVFQDTAFCQ